MEKRCLVTGAGGFIGSHLVDHLVREGWSVRALVRYGSTGGHGQLERLAPEVRSEVDVALGDVRDASQIDRLATDREVVLHLAALIGIPYSYAAPRSYVETNVVGTQNVLEAARRTGARVVLASTSEVYGGAQQLPMSEEHRLHPQSPYAASKVAADQLGLSYQRSFELPVVLVRPFNAYGPRQSRRAVIPTIVSQVLGRSDGMVELGATTPRRDFCYVADTARGFALAAVAQGVAGQAFNLASGASLSIGELAARIAALAGRPEVRVVQREERLRPVGSEVDRLEGDAGRAGRELGWAPEVGLDEGLRRVIEHVRAEEPAAEGRYVV